MENSDTQTLPPKQIEPLVGVVVIPTIVCPACKAETGLTKEVILDYPMEEDILCPNCSSVIYSCRPEIQKTTYCYSHWNGENWDD